MLTGKNISFSRGERTLFANLSFILKAGERLTVKGENGSGKSTLLRLLAGLIPCRSGDLLWKGESAYQHHLLYVGHKPCLHPQARVSDQLQLWKNLYKIPVHDIRRALKFWGIDELQDHRIAHLSQGQQKRLSLTRCHWLKRPLWILDEPEAGLDREGLLLLKNILSHHLEEGGSIVHATHNDQEGGEAIVLGGYVV